MVKKIIFVLIISFSILLVGEKKKQLDIRMPLRFVGLKNLRLKKNLKKSSKKKNVVKKKNKKTKKKEKESGYLKPQPPIRYSTSSYSSSSRSDRDKKEFEKIEVKHAKAISPRTKVFLDFKDAPLKDVIKWFSEKTKRNFILPKRLGREKITIMSPVPVTMAEAYRTFLTMLSVNNFSITRSGKFNLILNEREVASHGIDLYNQNRLPNLFKMVATILKFKHITSKNAEKIIKIFRDRGGTSYIFDDKTIILVDYAANIRKIREVIKELDVSKSSDAVALHFIKLNNISPKDAKKLIDKIFKEFKKNTRYSRGRNNKNKNLSLIPLKKGSSSSNISPDDFFAQIVADDRGEELIVMSNARIYSLLMQIIKHIDTEVAGEGQIHVVKLQNAKAKDILKTLTKVSKSKKRYGRNNKKGADVFEGEINISANESTNSLVIVSSTKDYRQLKKVIKQLDVRRLQVYIEAAIMEVTVREDLEYGSNMATGGFLTSIDGKEVPVFFGKSLTSPGKLGLVAGLLGTAVSGTSNIPGIGALGGVPSMGFLMNAAKNDSNINVVSTPHLLTTDNESAEIIVGSTIPFPSGNIINNTAGSQITYKREDVALKLKIKPQINESGYMTLDVKQELTQVQGQSQYGIITSKRSAKTIVNAEDEQPIVIGGLMKDTVSETEDKIPFLGDIPVIGNLFKYTTKKKEKINLLIILTPHIIRSREDFDRIYKEKLKEREDFAKRFYGDIKSFEASSMISKKRGPLLSIAEIMDKQHAEKLEKEKIKRKKNASLLISPNGEEKDLNSKELKNIEKEEDVPELDDEDLK